MEGGGAGAGTNPVAHYYCYVHHNSGILAGVTSPPPNAFVFQINVKNTTGLHYLCRETNQWVLHCNLNDGPHISEIVELPFERLSEAGFGAVYKEISPVLALADIPALEHPAIVAKISSTAVMLTRQFAAILENITIPIQVDVAKTQFQIIGDPFHPATNRTHDDNEWEEGEGEVEDWEEYDEDDDEADEDEDEDGEALNEVMSLSMEEEECKAVPAAPASIASLEKVKARESGECAICLGEMGVNQEVTRMPCDHTFHGPCIVEWLGRRHVCPLCRFQLPTAAPAPAPGDDM
ncbi:hypothetical protein DM860_017720 [Cuscuta australis]|uniref:RING-type E3 ubiquitin transferase n=1 Tax=Cuscuta australis TaxID=267555 RepID=A0A328DA27_9ASTE|nr:hypothetical protein DM860_017720 [Cuscuta australis]